MRMAFGLAGLLIVLGVIIWVLNSTLLPHTQQVARENRKATEQVSQLAGRDAATGMNAADSITLNPLQHEDRLSAILVTDIVTDGPMARYFGLQRNDTIVQVGPLPIRDMNTFEDARVMILDAYQRKQALVVVRDGEQITLPQDQPRSSDAPTPAPPPPSRSPLQRQLEQIPGIPTH